MERLAGPAPRIVAGAKPNIWTLKIQLFRMSLEIVHFNMGSCDVREKWKYSK